MAIKVHIHINNLSISYPQNIYLHSIQMILSPLLLKTQILLYMSYILY